MPPTSTASIGVNAPLELGLYGRTLVTIASTAAFRVRKYPPHCTPSCCAYSCISGGILMVPVRVYHDIHLSQISYATIRQWNHCSQKSTDHGHFRNSSRLRSPA